MNERDFSQDPGAPEATDPEATSAERAEAAAAEAAGEGRDEFAGEFAGENPASAGAGAGTAGADGVGEPIIEDPEADAAVEDVLGGEAAGDLEAAQDAAVDAAEEDAARATGDSGLQQQLNERTEDLQRVTAEYTNYRRRVERDRVAVIEGAKADVASKLLPILDDLDLAESHGDLTGPLKSAADKLQGVMSAIKVESFGAEGEEFNPDLHEAVQDTSSGDDKVLGTVLRKGYRLGDRVLRHAMVIIADA